MDIILVFFVIPIVAWIINMFAACHVIEKNCLARGESPPPTVGQTLAKYTVVTAIMVAVYSGILLLLGPGLGRALLMMTAKLGPAAPIWICVAFAAVFFVWEIYRHKAIPHGHLLSGANEIGLGALAISVVVWTAAILAAVGYILKHVFWSNVYYL
ncbi:hypothetical protein ERHA53_47130 (plasmid) [Erwinia rhapontici]|uniref:Uncharacterized protein n=1 Tax=Erwinia rhapontici TaxID=55212 RepID=A0ABN6DTP6_ERWRD|nr:hypothetical protein [Erwinia rhapontici]BCQ37370.1 hypothetical protein ERHA53_47130 [Erwinia rhapontici]